MSQVEYFSPTTIDEALQVIARNPETTRLIAGGTDLIPQMRNRLVTPLVLVDVRLLGLNQIVSEGEILQLGTAVTHTQVAHSPIILKYFPALASACISVGGPATRNRGTLGGNLVNASPAADFAPPLLVYDAILVICGQGYERTVPLAEFYKEYRETDLRPGEMVKEIHLPIPTGKSSSNFKKMGNRRALTIAVISAAVSITLGVDDLVVSARISLGSVAPIPIRARLAEEVLVKRKLDEKTIAQAAGAVLNFVDPISDIRAGAEYRRKMAEVLVRRSLERARDDLMKGGQA